ncbi:hypothetical protein CSC14_2293 [Proteus mirabilis]|nr:hypothetical protein CSC14_2293 [Proteus mirabilis]
MGAEGENNSKTMSVNAREIPDNGIITSMIVSLYGVMLR